MTTMMPPTAEPEHARRDVPHQPGGDRGGDHAADQQGRHPGQVDALGPRPARKPTLAATATRNSLVSMEPMTLRGSIRPLARIAGRAHRPPAAAAGGVDEAGDQAERGEEALAQGPAEAVAEQPEREPDQDVHARAPAGSAT